MGEFTIMSRLW